MRPIVTPPDDSRPSPRRLQLRRTKGWRKPAGGIVVTRPGKWGNPWRVGGTVVNQDTNHAHALTAREAVETYELHLRRGLLLVTSRDVRRELAGHDLYCWCAEGAPWCHGDVLLRIANGPAS